MPALFLEKYLPSPEGFFIGADMKVSMKLIGVDALNRKLEKMVKAAGHKNTEPLILKLAETIRDRIRQKAPVGPTGRLKRSPVAKLMPRKQNMPAIAIAGIDRKIAPHAHLVEFGTSRMAAHPFFRPAVDGCRRGVMERIKDGLKKLIEGAAR